MPYVIGIDEVGRGCLAGDVYVAAFMVSSDMTPILGVADSKTLSPIKRQEIFRKIKNTNGTFFKISTRTVVEIEQLGIDKAVLDCFQDAVTGLLETMNDNVSEVRIDGKAPPSHKWAPLSVPTRFIIDGDASDWIIGAASIIAKVTRDAYMVEMAKRYPGYGWERNCGYGTKEHTEAIKKQGMTPLHRIKFCRNFLSGCHPEKDPTDNIFSLL